MLRVWGDHATDPYNLNSEHEVDKPLVPIEMNVEVVYVPNVMNSSFTLESIVGAVP